MAPKGKNTNILADLAPTAAEVKAAQATVKAASAAEKRSQQGCFTSWCKRMGQDPELLKTRGDEREKLLVLYAVWQSRHGPRGKRTTTSESTEAHDDTVHETKRKWTKHQIIQNLGEPVWKAWKASGKLVPIPDKLTGSTDEEVCKYEVDNDYSDKSHSKGTKKTLETETEGHDQNDLPNIQQPKRLVGSEPEAAEAPGSSTDGLIKCKDEDDPDAKARQFMKDAEQHNTSVVTRAAELKIMLPLIQREPYAEKLADDVAKLIQKSNKISGALQRIIAKEECEIKAVPALMAQVEVLEKDVATAKEWAARFNVGANRTKRGRKRALATE